MAERSGFSSVAEIARGMGLQHRLHQRDTKDLSTIVDAGGHLILIRRGLKRPVWSKWEKRKPSMDVVAAHDGRIGLIPSSIGATALDVDYGDPSTLPPPWASYSTQRRGGEHLYYGDDEERGNQDWQANGCSGQVRGSKGFLILHKNGDKNIAHAILSGRQMNLWPFPAELLGLHEAGLIVPNPAKLHAVEPHGKASEKLEAVHPGARGESVFLVVRQWAYKQRRGPDLRAWCRRVSDFALESNHRLPIPLSEHEAAAIAYSVATWIWSRLNEIVPSKGKGPLDHSSIAQSWRGTWSGASRRAGTPLEEDRRPWESMGISRSTWYRRRRS